MAEKRIMTRIVHKHETEANWNKATNFIPKQGELIVYDVDSSHKYERIKIGDGVTTVSNLAFATEEAVDRLANDIELYVCTSYGPEPLSRYIATKGGFARLVKHVVVGEPQIADMVPTTSSWSKGFNDIIHAYIDVLTGIAYCNYKRPDGTTVRTTMSYLLNDTTVWDMGFVTSISEMTTVHGVYSIKHVSSVIDVVELPSTNIDPSKIYRVYKPLGNIAAEMIVFMGSANIYDLETFCRSAGWSEVSVFTYVVDALPESMEVTTTYAMHVYVLNNTGVGYVYSTDFGVVTLGQLAAALDSSITLQDKGWTTGLTDSTSAGIYAYRGADYSATCYHYAGNKWVQIASIDDVENTAIEVQTALSTKVDKVSGKGLSTNDYTTTEKNKLAGIASGAEVNQNAFAKITIGSTTITADAKQDTVTLVAGSNVTLTPDATNDKITIAATDTVYTHPSYTAADQKLYKVKVDSLGHVASVSEVVKADITALGIPAQDTVYTHPASHAASMITGLAKVATTGSYNDLSNKPTIPTVNNAALTIQKNGAAVATFTANSSTAVTANITVPTKVSELTNDSGYKTTDNNTTYSISKSGSTITLTGSDGSTSTVSDSNTVYTHPTYTAYTGKPTANQTPAFGGSVTVSQVTSDTQGHVSGMTDRTITIPATLSNGTGTAGLIKTTSTVATTSGYTPCPVLNGVPYYKDTNTTKITITATANDDDVVILTGANATNGVSYTATHAKKGPTSGYTSGNTTTSISGSGATGTIKIPQVTVDEYGHVTAAADESITIKMPSVPSSLKNPNALSIGGKSYDGSAAVSITAADLGIDNAIHFIGETTTALTDGATTSSITIGTATVAPESGDVVLYNSKEFLWNGSAWKELGDGSSHALKTITITAGDGLAGGGNLSANRTLTAKAGNGITVDTNGINHADTSSQASVTANGRKYITGVTLDTYGHVTGLTTATESVTDTNQKVKVGTATFGANDTVEFVAGNNIGLTASTTGKTITINTTLTGYTKGTSTADVAATDTLNTAIGKLEARIAALEAALETYVAQIYTLLGGE